MIRSRIAKIAITVGACIAIGAVGGLATDTGNWYQQLEKPVFNPPSWLFGPVWTTLYILIGYAGGLVWSQESASNSLKSKAMLWFWLQLGLNCLWSFSFFGLKNPLIGLINIVLLLAAIIYTITLFNKISKTSAWLMVPYIAWVSFATLLNGAIWWLNR